ncbi:hypothetical protein KSP40_PGU006676 [Platanthera guangdongensis]|uniref:Uncharacterized protein n=1 Tax=Platanthera guangdongensis TaxID=2320717 RepID=A0ABR2LDD9_9ASPA
MIPITVQNTNDNLIDCHVLPDRRRRDYSWASFPGVRDDSISPSSLLHRSPLDFQERAAEGPAGGRFTHKKCAFSVCRTTAAISGEVDMMRPNCIRISVIFDEIYRLLLLRALGSALAIATLDIINFVIFSWFGLLDWF